MNNQLIQTVHQDLQRQRTQRTKWYIISRLTCLVASLGICLLCFERELLVDFLRLVIGDQDTILSLMATLGLVFFTVYASVRALLFFVNAYMRWDYHNQTTQEIQETYDDMTKHITGGELSHVSSNGQLSQSPIGQLEAIDE